MFVWGGPKASRSLHQASETEKVYQEVLAGFSRIYSRDAPNSIPLLRLYP